MQFGGGAPQEMSFEILLDDLEGSYDIGSDLDRLFLMMETDSRFATKKKNSAPPPYVTFSWGHTNMFKAAVKSLSVQYLRFAPHGTPIRAQVKLTLIQVAKNDSRSGRGPTAAQNRPPARPPASAGTPSATGLVAVDGVRPVRRSDRMAHHRRDQWHRRPTGAAAGNPSLNPGTRHGPRPNKRRRRGRRGEVQGIPLDPQLAAQLSEVRVEENLMLPDAFMVRIADPDLKHLDAPQFEIGNEVEILFAPPQAGGLQTLTAGQIAALEPEFSTGGAHLTLRGYDRSHVLHRTRRTQTYQNSTADDVARKVADRAGLKAGTIDVAGAPEDFVQQTNETDWEFLWRLAARIDFEVLVVGDQAPLPPRRRSCRVRADSAAVG